MNSDNSVKPYRILIGGDLFPWNGNEDAFVSGNIKQLFDDKLIHLFDSSDYFICNLEGALTDSEHPIKKVDPLSKASKNAWNTYQRLGVSAVILANNHILDYGEKGFRDTIDVLSEYDVEWFGAGNKGNMKKSLSIIANKKKITFYAVSETMFNVPSNDWPGANLYDEYQVCQDISTLKQECDYLIVIYHGGTEFYWYGSEWLRIRFHRMADCGADFIISQHTHCIGLQEEYHGAHLFYGQGDFLFARRRGKKANPIREYGMLLEFLVDDRIEFKRYLLKHIDDSVVYDETQDFTEFDERSKAFANGELFDQEYGRFADEKLILFLEAFRGRNIRDRIAKRILSKKEYGAYLRKRYSESQLLRIISGVQFEEYRESVIRGLWNCVNNRAPE